MDYETILVSKEGMLGIITLNRPQAMNALSPKLVEEVSSALTEFEKDEGVRCIVITGSERAFSAGADVKDMVEKSAVEMAMTGHFGPFWNKVGNCPKPIVGALSGYVLGGGLELAMSLDVLIASETTQFGQPEINIGVMPGGGGTQRLVRAIGKSKAMEMILTGNRIGAEEAKYLGLVSRVVPKEVYLEEAKKVANDIASKSPVAVRMAKLAVNKSFQMGLSDGLDFERELFFLLFASEDKKEGMSAFVEKRKPVFKGK